ncbi:hypothetical protein Ptr902_10148 [Pyrenophora tritici-repentis]|nr:hypothetical protein Ptr902_10148 [Pyrenophora tritici-repentis]
MVHDPDGIDEADSVSEALVSEGLVSVAVVSAALVSVALLSVALAGTLLLSEEVAVKESEVDSTLDTLLADEVSSEELGVSTAEDDSETVPVSVAEEDASEDVAVAELKEKEKVTVLLQT